MASSNFTLLLPLALLAGLMALAAYRWRIARLTRRQAELEQLVAERTAALEASQRALDAERTSDADTGVSNRRGFDTALETEWRRAARTGQGLALILLEIDYFAPFQARYGAPAAEACLRNVAALVKTHGRRSTDLVARHGDARFALLAAATNAADAYGTAQAICAEVARLELAHAGAPSGIVTISLGVAVLAPGAGHSAALLVRQAENALRGAQDKGRNQALLAIAVE